MLNFALDLNISLKAETLFKIGPFSVTNSMVYGLVTVVLFFVIMLWATKKISSGAPQKGLAGLIEVLTEFVRGLIEGPLGSRELANKYTAFFGVFFFFIITANLMELLPIVGPMFHAVVGGEQVPVLRPFTADLNGTIAMSIVATTMVQYFSIKEQGLKNHILHYFDGKIYNPLNIFVGFMEIIGEFSRLASLSMRLFLYTEVGEILILIFSSLVIGHARTPFLALPILIFEGMIAVLQAYIYVILCSSYLGTAISRHRQEAGINPEMQSA